MKFTSGIKKSLVPVLIVALLWGCGGGDSKTPPAPTQASVTITGLVTDKIISNAEVKITVGENEFLETADENGVYTITITVDESLINQLVQIRAIGDSNINPEVEFVSQLGSLSSLIEQAGEDGNLTQKDNFGVNVTNVTTAEYALLSRDGEIPTTDTELKTAISALNSDEKNTLAALIKIVVDNENHKLPTGVTTLNLVNESAIATAFEQDVISQDPTLIAKTISSIVNDNSLTSESGIVGTWKIGTEAITFTRSGHYIHITTEIGEEGDKIGYEVGSYSWNEATGSLSFITTEDSNGDSGLHDEFEQLLNTQIVHVGTFNITNDMLTIDEEGEVFVASRLASSSNPLVGGYYLPNTNFSDDLSIAITLDDGKSIILFRSNSNALPSGTSYFYLMRENSYDAQSALRIVHSQQVYVNGNITGELTEEVKRDYITVQGDVISLTNADNTSFIKSSYTTTTQEYLTYEDIIGGFSGTVSDDIDFNITFNGDDTGQGNDQEGSFTFNWTISFGQLALSFNDGSSDIWSAINFDNNTWHFNVNYFDSMGEFDGSATGTLTPSDTSVSAPIESSIVGTWTESESTGGMFSLTFSNDGHYVHMQEADPFDACQSDGYEVGTYNWDEITGVVIATTSEDTNGCIGLHNEQPLNQPFELDVTIQVVGASMTITEPSGEVSHFNRIISDTNPIIGAYYEGDFEGDFFLIVFEDNGTFMELAHDIDELGLTAGTYNWDASNSLLDFTSITLNQWGANLDQNIVSMQGDILIWKDGLDAGISKRTHQSTEQPYLTDTNQVIGDFIGIANDNFGFKATVNSNFTGVTTDDDGTYAFEWSIQFGQLIVDYGDEITILSPTTISSNVLKFNVADFDLIDTFNGNEVGQVEYFTNTWTRD
jgi:hypothetical protein